MSITQTDLYSPAAFMSYDSAEADACGSKLPFNLSINTCLQLGRAWNTNAANANAN